LVIRALARDLPFSAFGLNQLIDLISLRVLFSYLMRLHGAFLEIDNYKNQEFIDEIGYFHQEFFNNVLFFENFGIFTVKNILAYT
jgi:hypothetical protein